MRVKVVNYQFANPPYRFIIRGFNYDEPMQWLCQDGEWHDSAGASGNGHHYIFNSYRWAIAILKQRHPKAKKIGPSHEGAGGEGIIFEV